MTAVLNEVDLEALMVLLGMDAERVLYAVGLHALGQDIGSLCVLSESLAHRTRAVVSAQDVRTRGHRWYAERADRLRAVDPDLFRRRSGDPRRALQLAARRIIDLLGPDCDIASAGLLAACVLLDRALPAVAADQGDAVPTASVPAASVPTASVPVASVPVARSG